MEAMGGSIEQWSRKSDSTLYKVLGMVLLALALSSISASAIAQTQSLFTTQTPAIGSASDGVPYELGMKFQVSRSGQITALRYWKAAGDSGLHVGRLWSAAGALMGSVTFSGETASGWQEQ